MKIDIDRFREILDTLSRNKSRSLLTGFGVFWGVFMLVALLGGGRGLEEKLQGNFKGFAANAAIIWAQPTTKPYAGVTLYYAASDTEATGPEMKMIVEMVKEKTGIDIQFSIIPKADTGEVDKR